MGAGVGRSRLVVDQCELAEDLAAAEDRQTLFSHPWHHARDAHRAVDDDVQGVALLALGALLVDLDHESSLAAGREIDTVFLGGGTPSLFAPREIARLLEGIAARLFLEELLTRDLDFSRLVVWPGDDRIVPEDHEASNTGKLRFASGASYTTNVMPDLIRHLATYHLSRV